MNKNLCFKGKMDLDHLMIYGTPEQVAEQAWVCENIGKDGEYILST